MSEVKRIDWNSYAKDYDRERILGRNRLLLDLHREVLHDFLSFFAPVDLDARVIDIGCASGFFLTILRELGFENIEGADVSEVFVARAREKGFSCRVMDILNPEIADGEKRFDIVLLMDTLEHLSDPLKALKNVAEFFLKSDGTVFITVPLYDSAYGRWKRFRRRQSRLEYSRGHDSTHIQAFTKKEWYGLVREAGFTVMGAKRLHCPLPFLPSERSRALANLLFPSCLKGAFLRVVARPAA